MRPTAQPCGTLTLCEQSYIAILLLNIGVMILDYGHLGELRALIPPKVHMIALTATATKTSRENIM